MRNIRISNSEVEIEGYLYDVAAVEQLSDGSKLILAENRITDEGIVLMDILKERELLFSGGIRAATTEYQQMVYNALEEERREREYRARERRLREAEEKKRREEEERTAAYAKIKIMGLF